MKRTAKILTFWIPIKSWRKKAFDKIISMLLRFIPIHHDWVVFYDTFSKSGNGDSIRPLAEELRRQKSSFKFFFVAQEKKNIEMADEVLIIGSKRYNDVIVRAKYLFSPMDLPAIKNRGQIWVMTWHGSPLKKIYSSQKNNKRLKKFIPQFKKIDFFCNASSIHFPILSEAFHISKEVFVNTGLPRNDILFIKNTDLEKEKIKRKIGLPPNKKILFYCPTWRRYDWKQPMPFNLDQLKKELQKDFVILLRSHVGKHDWVDPDGCKIDLSNNGFAYDVGDYDNISELYLISDLLITDYSSAIFDFSILKRPQIFYAYDLKDYEENPGLYFDYCRFSPFPVVFKEKKLIETIKTIRFGTQKSYQEFYKKYANYEKGTATKQLIKLVLKKGENQNEDR